MAKKKKKIAKKKKREGKPHAYWPARTEAEHIEDIDEDFRDAWLKLREYCAALGEQRIYTSAKAIMFARRTCYLFVRFKKSYVEVTFFLHRKLSLSDVFRINERSKTKFEHVYKLTHADQVEEPLTDWIQEAFNAHG